MQIDTKPQPAKKLIDATVPGGYNSTIKDVPDHVLKALHAKWEAEALERNRQVAAEVALPTDASRVLRFELRKYGRHWQSYIMEGKKARALLPAPSLLVSALDALDDAISDTAWKHEHPR